MIDRHTNEWRTDEIRDLLETILSLRDVDEAERFFRDLCTLGELEAMAHRWAVAKLLDGNGLPYHEIARRTGASTAGSRAQTSSGSAQRRSRSSCGSDSAPARSRQLFRKSRPRRRSRTSPASGSRRSTRGLRAGCSRSAASAW